MKQDKIANMTTPRNFEIISDGFKAVEMYAHAHIITVPLFVGYRR